MTIEHHYFLIESRNRDAVIYRAADGERMAGPYQVAVAERVLTEMNKESRK